MSISPRILIPLAATALLFLAACGNKGPLVLPQTPVPVEEVAEPVDAPLDDSDSDLDSDQDNDPELDDDVPPAVAPPPPVQSTPATGGGNG